MPTKDNPNPIVKLELALSVPIYMDGAKKLPGRIIVFENTDKIAEWRRPSVEVYAGVAETYWDETQRHYVSHGVNHGGWQEIEHRSLWLHHIDEAAQAWRERRKKYIADWKAKGVDVLAIEKQQQEETAA